MQSRQCNCRSRRRGSKCWPKEEVECCFRINDPAIKHTTTQHAPFLMLILIPRAVTPRLSTCTQLATSSQRCSHTQVRYLHETAAADSVQHHADSEEHVNEYAPPLRARKHGFKPLPMSPLMGARNAKAPRTQIAQQQDALKDFQKEVAVNPYGTHIPRSHFLRKTLTLSPSTSTSNSYSTLRSYACTPTLPLPASIHNNG